MEIKSPLSKIDLKSIAFDRKLKKLFEDAEVEGAFIFYIPKEGDVIQYDVGLCGHQLEQLSETIAEIAQKRLEVEDCEE